MLRLAISRVVQAISAIDRCIKWLRLRNRRIRVAKHDERGAESEKMWEMPCRWAADSPPSACCTFLVCLSVQQSGVSPVLVLSIGVTNSNNRHPIVFGYLSDVFLWSSDIFQYLCGYHLFLIPIVIPGSGKAGCVESNILANTWIRGVNTRTFSGNNVTRNDDTTRLREEKRQLFWFVAH